MFFYIGGFDIKINKPDDIPYFIKDYRSYILLSLFVIAIICLVIIVFNITKSVKNDFKAVKNLTNQDNMIKSLRNLLYCFIGLALIALVVITCAPAEQKINATIQATIFFMFIIFYLWIVYLNSLILRYIILMIGYIVVITMVIGINIAILNPLIGKMIDNKIDLEGNWLIQTTIAYTILMFLVLFSLQKTARKNSIIPN